MSSVAEEQGDGATSEPPTKRRRGGRRSSQPEVSAEERKRLRVLKNRESAMRSLAKKAEYSAKLEAEKKEVAAELSLSRENLRKLLASSIGLRTALEKIPDDLDELIDRAETAIDKGNAALSADEEPLQLPLRPQEEVPESLAENVANGDSPDATN